MLEKLILGTRGSELARAQTLSVEKAIRAVNSNVRIETKIIATRGDGLKAIDSRAGRKGIFTAEIEQALLSGDVDVAVHSAKDLPSEMNPRAEIGAVLARAPVNDVLISKYAGGLASLPHGSTLATGSVRRNCQLHWKRADLKLIDLRGNVPTRLRKLAENDWDAIVLARAGLERLRFSSTSGQLSFNDTQFFLEILACETFMPAGGQGIIALQIRASDLSAKALLDPINDRETLLCLRAERGFLRRLHADCNFPVGVLATISNGQMKVRAQLFEDQSSVPREAEVQGACGEGEALVAELSRMIKRS